MKKTIVFGAVLLSLSLVLGGCGSDDDTTSANEPEPATEDEQEGQVDQEEPSEEQEADNSVEETEAQGTTEDEGDESGDTEEAGQEEQEEATTDTGASDDSLLNPSIPELSEGDIEVIYTNSNAGFVHDMDGFVVSVDEYQLVKIEDMNRNMTIPFNDEVDGYLVTAKITVDNQKDTAMYYPMSLRIQINDQYDYSVSQPRLFIDDTDVVVSEMEEEVSKYGAGEKVSGLVSFAFSNEEYERLTNTNPKFIISGGAADNDQFSGGYREEGVFDFIYSSEQGDEVSSRPDLYQSKLVTDNIAEQSIIFEDTSINQEEMIDDVRVTLKGVQYTELEPTASFEEAFTDTGDGLVALTVLFHVDNQSDSPISMFSTRSMLTVDTNRARYMPEGMLEPGTETMLESGNDTEDMKVFLFYKDEFELYENFELEYGPFYGEDGRELFKADLLNFTLPR
ncbi:DUF5068 domain-containing protein [Alteribacter keqinensis]|uniref:DUF5068 domain-containing protein n=1 Tax=Alteribacter keqinensis TaxID=2483800 RepID=A0A3M7TZ05_9BACI|nr:DUF5068 domain-containing protein [Alteribacter keqinensis]RNA70479.1 DUF5068 domain-containing protein [Alteribacter keqinensis]